MYNNVCSFGELLLRLSPGNDWLRENQMPFFIGGAELNAAVALANWKIPVKYISAVPDNYLSKQVIEFITEMNIDCSEMIYCGNRIGIYYLPVGSELKHTGVIYDRTHSSFAELKKGTMDWDKIFSGCNWFHFSAISPALNNIIPSICLEALEAASAKGLTISVDLNYRSKLWQYGKDPTEVMQPLLKYCNVIMGNLWAAESLLGIQTVIKESAGKSHEELIDAAGKSMLQIHKQYPNVGAIAYTFRMEKEYWAVLQHGSEMVVSKKMKIKKVVDKVGSGDCFMAGLIYGLYKQHPSQEIIDFAAAAAVGKLQEAGDATKQVIEDVKQRMLL